VCVCDTVSGKHMQTSLDPHEQNTKSKNFTQSL